MNFHIHQMRILVTSYCNLNCNHCYQHKDKNLYSLSKEAVKNLTDFALRAGVTELVLSGGEFFMHPDAYEILNYCTKHLNITVVTNGINIDLEYFRNFQNNKRIVFQVSIDGLRVNHDRRRGIGSFCKTMNNVCELVSMGFTVIASMAVDETNYMDMLSVLEMPEFSKVNYLPVASTGAALDYGIDNQYCDRLLLHLYRESIALGEQTDIYPFSLGIKYNGDVYLSPVAQDMDVFWIGNIHNNSIIDILNKYHQTDPYGLLIHKNEIMGECKQCEMKNVCSIRSLERAYKTYGNIYASDPFGCMIFKNMYSGIPISKVFWGEI